MKKIDRTHPDIDRPKVSINRGRKGISKLPALETMFEDEGDPLEDVDYDPADLEASAEGEMSEIVRQIKEKKKALQDRFRVARDPDYWIALCFQSHEQRDEFLRASGWAGEGTKYLNGLEIARKLGVEVKAIEIAPIPLRGKPHKYTKEEVI